MAGPPQFELRPIGRGLLELTPVGFEAHANTKSVQAGTLGLHYRDELEGPPQGELAATVTATEENLSIASARILKVNDLLQISGEILRVEEVDTTGANCRVTRGMYDTVAAVHSPGTSVIYLRRKVVTIGFPREFFGSPAAESYSYSIDLPSSRLAAATLFVTNDQGNSPTAWRTYTTLPGSGLRTYGGGQLSLQVPGMLAIEANATPPLIIQDATSVRDVFATVAQPASGSDIEVEVTLNGSVYSTLTIPMNGHREAA
ncbi:MAG: hypothetical protein NTY38_13350 [Acidobacteria bacterium]|nr:hypothetical protein [Acidobacteriota bacterium]